MPSERQYRREIVLFGRALHERGYVAAMDGNLSVRLDERHILATPTSMCKGMMKPSDLVIVDMDGRTFRGRRDVSSEIAMHLLIYKLRPDVQGVVHAHPPTATGFAAAGMALNQPLVCEVVIGLGSIPLAKYGTPGTPELTAGARTAGSAVRCHSDVEPRSGGLRRRPALRIYEDGDGRAFCPDCAGHASARTAATSGQRGTGKIDGGAEQVSGIEISRSAASGCGEDQAVRQADGEAF